MKILQISPQIPLPLDNGGRIGIYGITKHLSELGHEIHFVTYRKDSDKEWAERELKKICIPYILDYNPQNNIISAFFNLFSPIPYNISKFESKILRDFLMNFFSKEKIDIVHIDHLHMGWAIKEIRKYSNVPVVIREHNLELKIMQRFYQNNNNFFLRKYAEIQYNKFLKYEPGLCAEFDKCIMITPNDEEELLNLNKNIKTIIIPVGVNEELLSIAKKNIEPYSLFHLGSVKWLPNYEGLKWFLKEIYPLMVNKIPQLKLYLYGEGSDSLQIPGNIRANVESVGYVNNIWEEINNKALAIVPLKTGSGIRVKIIELLATGQTIISTSVGKEGIFAEDNKHILIADSAEEFINKSVSFFNNMYNNMKISENAKELVREKYTWKEIAKKFEQTYSEVINSRKHF